MIAGLVENLVGVRGVAEARQLLAAAQRALANAEEVSKIGNVFANHVANLAKQAYAPDAMRKRERRK